MVCVSFVCFGRCSGLSVCVVELGEKLAAGRRGVDTAFFAISPRAVRVQREGQEREREREREKERPIASVAGTQRVRRCTLRLRGLPYP